MLDFSQEMLQQDAVIQPRKAASYGDAIADFTNTIRNYGIVVDSVVPDGEIHRCSTEDKPSKKNGWYSILELDNGYFYAKYGNWRESDEGHVWKSWSETGMTSMDRQRIETRLAQHREQTRQKMEQAQSDKATWINQQIAGLPQATEHPYLTKKHIKVYGDVRYDASENSLVIPLISIDGEILGCQRIYAEGKDELGGGNKKSQGVIDRASKKPFAVMPSNDNDTIYVCEGFATGASVREATDKTTVIALHANRLKTIGLILRERFPDAELIYVADNDVNNNTGNKGLKHAREAAQATNGEVINPDIDGGGLDANDIAVKYGYEILKTVLGVDGKSMYGIAPMREIVEQEYPHNPVAEGLLDESECLLLVGDSNLGKSIITLYMAAMFGNPDLDKPAWQNGKISFDGPPMLFEHFPILSRSKCLFLQDENSGKNIKKRFDAMCEKNEMIKTALDSDSIYTVTVGENNDPCAVGSLGDPVLFKSLKVSIIKENIRVLFVDPMSSYLGAEDENNNTEVLNLLNKTFRRLARETGCAVVVIHHTSKAGVERGGRGASSIRGWADSILMGEEIENDEDGKVIKMIYDKSRSFERRPAEWYMRMGNDLNFSLLDDYEPPTEHSSKNAKTADTCDVVRIVEANGEFVGKTALVNAIASEIGCSKANAREVLDRAVVHGLIRKFDGNGPMKGVRYTV